MNEFYNGIIIKRKLIFCQFSVFLSFSFVGNLRTHYYAHYAIINISENLVIFDTRKVETTFLHQNYDGLFSGSHRIEILSFINKAVNTYNLEWRLSCIVVVVLLHA